MFLAKSKLNKIEVLSSKALIDSVTSHDEFVLINSVQKKMQWYERRNKKFRNFINLSKIVACF